jgi:hypothetical protein
MFLLYRSNPQSAGEINGGGIRVEWFCTITGVLGFIVQFRPKILWRVFSDLGDFR